MVVHRKPKCPVKMLGCVQGEGHSKCSVGFFLVFFFSVFVWTVSSEPFDLL